MTAYIVDHNTPAPKVDREALRDATERVLWRAEYLSEPDRSLIEAHRRYGVPIRKLAVLTGDYPENTQHRIASIERRLTSDAATLAINMQREAPDHIARIARLIYIDGQPLREVAQRSCMTLWAVRKVKRAIDRAISTTNPNT